MKEPAVLLVLFLCVGVYEAAAKHTYSCWLNGWRKNANDAAKASYAMTFNLPLDGLGESKWIFAG